MRRLAEEAVASAPRARVEIEVVEAYRNMREYLRGHVVVADMGVAVAAAGHLAQISAE